MCAAFFPPHIGGIERYVFSISKHLNLRGWKVTILTTQLHNTALTEKYYGLRIVRIPSVSLASGRMPIPKIWQRAVRKSLRDLLNSKPDVYVIHTHLFPLSLIGAAMGWSKSNPALVIGHGTGHIRTGKSWLDSCLHIYEHLMAKTLNLFSESYFAVSHQAEVWWSHFGIKSSGTIHNGVDLKDTPAKKTDFLPGYGLSEQTKIVAFAARLLPDKGADTVINAFNAIETRYPDLYLFIAGDGPAANSLITLAAGHPRIVFLGEVDHSTVLSLLDAADIFAYPSRYPEGLPTCILEAGLMNCAVVATPAGGVKEILIDSDHGMIIESELQLQETLCTLLENESLRKKLAKKLRARVIAYFNWDRISEELEVQMISSIDKRNLKS